MTSASLWKLISDCYELLCCKFQEQTGTTEVLCKVVANFQLLYSQCHHLLFLTNHGAKRKNSPVVIFHIHSYAKLTKHQLALVQANMQAFTVWLADGLLSSKYCYYFLSHFPDFSVHSQWGRPWSILVRAASAHCWEKIWDKNLCTTYTPVPRARGNKGGGLATGDLARIIRGGFCLTCREAMITVKHCHCCTTRGMCQKTW